ncbi:DUF948 domain-containing protein [Bacillus hwajinpoensis]|uniref:DUF948 domain-containing protein n=1 Tax=Guptibacillus hwajinpoensis TaxID=208199 RepID=A0A845F4D4_9BACL|nr:DUF948 domain-containing protein [Pseudalkalibacillus hwajinpoensis]MYL65660.1 DUF948 domain-containing protein [Pseudalkalibacillus hwajinpoensis]
MELILYLAVALIAIVFAVLSIFLIKVLKSTEKTLSNTAEMIDSLQGQIDGLSKETTMMLHKTNVLADEVQSKVGQFSPVFKSVQETGASLQNLSRSFSKLSKSVEKGVEARQGKAAEAANWGSTALSMWEKYRNKKSNIQAVKEEGKYERV